MKKLYIDLMEAVAGAYTAEHIREYTLSVIKNGLSEHGFPRLTANLGILIAHGRKTEFKNDFHKMMDLCCKEIPVALQKNGHSVGNDFSVKEIVLCLLEIEKAGIFEKRITDGWRSKLSKINPYTTYSVIAQVPPKRIGNWAAFGAASEQLRKYAGIGNENAFIENQIESQILSFDENGMYRDPNEPMVYDMVTRLQLAVALYFGFDGKCRRELEDILIKSADITLYMQSVTGEIPFGGRSNQFLHNETFYAALCEFYADALNKRGDVKKAGMFKRAATIAAESIIPWLNENDIHHIKNQYSVGSKYGCEDYAYFDKYMATTASWLYLAYIMADDSISEINCPSEIGGYICETTKWFHKVFCNFGGYFVELDTNADPHYDASGIGRIHKTGAPSAICLSVPFCENPNYEIDISNQSAFSVCGGIKTKNGYVYAFDSQTEYRIIKQKITDTFVQIKFECKQKDGIAFYETCTVSDSGVEVTVEGEGELEILFPIFDFDGKYYTEKSVFEKRVQITYNGYICRYVTNGIIKEKNTVYANRNGHYKAAAACGKNSVSLKIDIFAK